MKNEIKILVALVILCLGSVWIWNYAETNTLFIALLCMWSFIAGHHVGWKGMAKEWKESLK